MTNVEKCKKELRSIECTGIAVNKWNGDVAHCDAIQCEECSFNNSYSDDSCDAERVKWIIYEYENILNVSRLEYEILKYLSEYTNYKYIAKDKDGICCVFVAEPERKEWYWAREETEENLSMFKEAFLFLDWEDEPMLINNILERAKVIENE